MASEPQEENVTTDGEDFSLLVIPNAQSRLVQSAKDELLKTLDLQRLVEDLGQLGNFIRVAYNGVAGYTEVQIKVQRVGYRITELADKSAVTVNKFQRASKRALQELRGTYQYLLDGQEQMALQTMSQVTSIAKDMVAAADELRCEFEQVTKDVVAVLEVTQKAKGSQERRKKARERETMQLERKKNVAAQQKENAIEAERNAEALFNEAKAREEKSVDAQNSVMVALADALKGVASAVGCSMKFQFWKAIEKLQNISDKSAYQEAIKTANEEKKKQWEELRKQRNLRQEALLQYMEFAERIKSCKDDGELAEAAIEALHRSIGALKSISTIMMNAALFWREMQTHCESSLTTEDIQKSIQTALTSTPKEDRLKVWRSDPFKKKALRFYAEWVALDGVCNDYMKQLKSTRNDLYKYLEENPTTEQARSTVRQLAVTFAESLKEAQQRLAQDEEKALEEKASFEDSL